MLKTLDSGLQNPINNLFNNEVKKRVFASLSKLLETDIDSSNLNLFVQDLKDLLSRLTSPKLKRLIVIALFMAGAYTVKAQEGQTSDTFPIAATVTANGLRVRVSPDFNGEVIDHLNAGETVSILDFDGDWAMVNTDEDPEPEGFVNTNYLDFNRDLVEEAPTIENVNGVINAQSCGSNDPARFASPGFDRTCYAHSNSVGIDLIYADRDSGLAASDIGRGPGRYIHALANIGSQFQLNIDGASRGTYQVINTFEVDALYAEYLVPSEYNNRSGEIVVLFTCSFSQRYNDPALRNLKTVVIGQRVS